MPKEPTKRNPVAAAAEPSEQQSRCDPVIPRRLDEARRKWETISDFLTKVAELDRQIHGNAILGLMELFEFGDTIGEGSKNWFGVFIVDVLNEVAAAGALEVNNRFDRVEEILQRGP
jgi:hypothetical protein